MPDYRTTHPGAKAGLPSLRTGVSCVLRAAVICVVACISLLMIPVNVYVSFSGLYIGGNHAYADDGSTGEPPLPKGAKERAYIDEMASESGLTSSEFVATTINVLATTTGMVITRNPGVRLLNATLGDNLDNLMDAADYPDWDSLDSSEQMQYGSKENYDSTKYVALMDAFDLTDGYERFAATGTTGSGGGKFEFTTAEAARLQKLGRIGNNWINKIGSSIGSIRGTLKDDFTQSLYRYLYGESSSNEGELSYRPEGTTWPEGKFYKYTISNMIFANYQNATGSNASNYYYVMKSLDTVYCGIRHTSGNSYKFEMFSKAPFIYGSNNGSSLEIEVPISTNATSYTDTQDRTYYYGSINASLRYLNFASQTVNEGISMTNDDYASILYEESGSGGEVPGELEPDITGYPETQVPESTVVYYPVDGISPNTTWNQYTALQRPDNPFNPDDETSTPEWQQETKQNIQGLQGVHFEKLFPFCLYYDLDKFWKKVQSICGISTDENGQLNTQDNNNYNEVNLRMYVPNVMDEVWTFDLEPLRDMLLIIKPFMLVFLICVEIVSMIMLWKGILTGS